MKRTVEQIDPDLKEELAQEEREAEKRSTTPFQAEGK